MLENHIGTPETSTVFPLPDGKRNQRLVSPLSNHSLYYRNAYLYAQTLEARRADGPLKTHFRRVAVEGNWLGHSEEHIGRSGFVGGMRYILESGKTMKYWVLPDGTVGIDGVDHTVAERFWSQYQINISPAFKPDQPLTTSPFFDAKVCLEESAGGILVPTLRFTEVWDRGLSELNYTDPDLLPL